MAIRGGLCRLPPIGNTFVNDFEEDKNFSLLRSYSFSGYVSNHLTKKQESAYLNITRLAQKQKKLSGRTFDGSGDLDILCSGAESSTTTSMTWPSCGTTHLAGALASSSGSGDIFRADSCIESAASDTSTHSVVPADRSGGAHGAWSTPYENDLQALSGDDSGCCIASHLWPDTDEESGWGIVPSFMPKESWPATDHVLEHNVDHSLDTGSEPIPSGNLVAPANVLKSESNRAGAPILCDVSGQGCSTEVVPGHLGCHDKSVGNARATRASILVPTPQPYVGHQGKKHPDGASMAVRDAMVARASAAAAAALKNLSAGELRHKSREVGERRPYSSASTSQVSAETVVAATATEKPDCAIDSCTTLMIRNLPPGVTQQQLLEEINASGFAGLYDFCYMPTSFWTGTGSGSAFANFMSCETATRFATMWHQSHRFEMTPTGLALEVSPAKVQGRDANLVKYATGRMRHMRRPRFEPFVLDVWTPPDSKRSPRHLLHN